MTEEKHVDFSWGEGAVTMTVSTWEGLQAYRDLPIFAEIKGIARKAVEDNKCFRVYYSNVDAEIYTQCNNLDEVEKLFSLPVTKKS